MTIELSLSTSVRPAQKFTVDGNEYELYDMDHLTPEQESEVLALFARFANIAAELDATSNVLKGRELADRLRATRVSIIVVMTNVPKGTVEQLPLSQQALLVEAMQNDMEEEQGADGAKPGAGDGD